MTGSVRTEKRCLPRNGCYRLVAAGLDERYSTEDPTGSLKIAFDGIELARLTNLKFVSEPVSVFPEQCAQLDCSGGLVPLEVFILREPESAGVASPLLSVNLESVFTDRFDRRFVEHLWRSSMDKQNDNFMYFRECKASRSCNRLELDMARTGVGLGEYFEEVFSYRLQLDGDIWGDEHFFASFVNNGEAFGWQKHQYAGHGCDVDEVCGNGYQSLLSTELVTSPRTSQWISDPIQWEIRGTNADIDSSNLLFTDFLSPGETYRRFECFSPWYGDCALFHISSSDIAEGRLNSYAVEVDGIGQDVGTYCDDFLLGADLYDCLDGFEATVIGGECGGISVGSAGEDSSPSNSVIWLAILIPMALVGAGFFAYIQHKNRDEESSALPSSTRAAQHRAQLQALEVTAVPVRMEQPLSTSKSGVTLASTQTNDDDGRRHTTPRHEDDDDSYC